MEKAAWAGSGVGACPVVWGLAAPRLHNKIAVLPLAGDGMNQATRWRCMLHDASTSSKWFGERGSRVRLSQGLTHSLAIRAGLGVAKLMEQERRTQIEAHAYRAAVNHNETWIRAVDDKVPEDGSAAALIVLHWRFRTTARPTPPDRAFGKRPGEARRAQVAHA